MTLSPGSRVGPYEITGQLGAGGMGEVCRARDTKLNRDVALKVLPEAFATDPDRMSRFQREAQLLAALNHPNIAAIYGLEDGGTRQAIAMELVDGTAIKGPLPIGDALRIVKQLADAIEYAHDRGIIHRDLKPDNIKVTPDGAVKVLDFGLAKAMDDAVDPATSVFATMSPTLSLGATHAGVIMGTAAYMAPEQAKGRPADRRSDVWAFGIVLYEILTGDRMFGGDSVPETLASVMKDPITFGKLPDETPAAIRTLVSRCLERDPRRRLQSIGEARIVIEDVIAGVSVGETEAKAAPIASPANKWPWVVAGAAILAFAAAIAWIWSRPAPPLPPVTRFTLPPPNGAIFTTGAPNAPVLAASPDGRYVAFVADGTGRDRTLWVRALDSLVSRQLDRTEGAMFPFWSPDSQHIAYFANGKLMRVSIAGGAPHSVAEAPNGEGGAWFEANGEDGVIVFAPELTGGLSRVLAKGGVPAPVTQLAKGETSHSFPQFLPDGRFLYLAEGNNPGIYVQTLGTDARTRVVDTIGRAMYSPPGQLLYLRENTLLAHRWNLDTLQLEGEPVSITDDVRSGGSNGRNAFTVSATGMLVYRGGASLGNLEIVSYTREGKPEAVVLDAGEYGPFELSPDGHRLVVINGLGNDRDLWVKDLVSGVFSRLTLNEGQETDPFWSPDSRRVGYIHVFGGKRTWYETLIGSGRHTPIPVETTVPISAEGWTPDGKYLIARAGGLVTLLPAPQEGSSSPEASKPRTVFNEKYPIDQVRVSPNGKWVAYTSHESGQPEVNIASFPSFTERRQISSGGPGAAQPLWRPDGRELFFLRRDGDLISADVNADTGETGPVRQLFRTTLNTTSQVHMYAVARDGKQFLLRVPKGSTTEAVEQLQVVTNWTSLVAR